MKQTPFANLFSTRKSETFRNAFLILFVLIMGLVTGARAATFTVTKAADTNDGVCNTDCSLREAIAAARAAATDDVIKFDSGVFSTPQNLVPVLGTFQICANGSLVIDGPGANLLALDGADFVRLFFIQSSSEVSLNNLTIRRGLGGGNLSFCLDRGGAICNDGGNLVLNSIVFNGNQSHSSSGAIDNIGGALAVTGSTFNNNSAANGDGGAIRHSSAAPLSITNSTFNGNKASHSGGAVFNSSGTLTISSAVFTSNQTTALSNDSGGAIRNESGAMTITDTTIK